MMLLELHERNMVSGTEVVGYYLATNERCWNVRKAATRHELKYCPNGYDEIMRSLRKKAWEELNDALLRDFGYDPAVRPPLGESPPK